MWHQILIQFITLLAFIPYIRSVELTFELPDSAEQCFYEEIHRGTKSTIEYQVVTGGQYDVDMVLKDPRGTVLYQGRKKQYDSHVWTADQTGVFSFCFGNQFSTFSHKLVYFDLQVGDEQPLPGVGDHQTAMTKVEQSVDNIHKTLNQLMEEQTHYKLNEATGRKRAEHLNSRVFYWSVSEAVLVVIISLSQVFILKNFFSDKKHTIRT